MTLKLGVIRGATEVEVKSKKFNIYLGISLGNKWFSKNNTREHLKFALKYAKDRVGLVVADTLHAINYEVRDRISYEKAIKKSFKKGTEFIEMLKELIGELPEKERKVIDIIRWEDVKKDRLYKKILPIVKKEFKNNRKFKEAILAIIWEHIKLEKREFSEKELERFGDYLLEELPEVLNGFIFKNTYYNCYLYPYDTKFTQFIADLQNGKIFAKVSKKIIDKHNVFVELKTAI